ncbi:MAG: transporter substrate-binding protein, partial [Nitrospira sp.]|nr:transporter substrate-binding protein [Nitrospira sp.]
METKQPHDSAGVKHEEQVSEDRGSSRREFLGQTGRVAAGVGVAALLGNLGNYALSYAAGGPPIKIGILHSLSGPMAISEVSLRDVVMMAVEEINHAGGVMGRQIEAVIVDPASN